MAKCICILGQRYTSNFNFYESEHETLRKNQSDFYRWAYTAVTRASKKLFCINPPYFSSFSEMNFIDVNVQKAFNELTGENSNVVELEFAGEVLDHTRKVST